ncbi:hypothetical protein [Mucilaginibacter agri]|uniref:Uncharacterized protein n=1 Tax=Mucilaginibacter agri TaxID=2695265 RepID=A0A965ZC27_9SPHI|nr:hypothetical protein [Mucilaginibacter agri]NCD68269.1 hypothetical protein [Mucilaginibacter agri]
MKNKRGLIVGVLFSSALLAILWKVTAFIQERESPELTKQVLASAFLCWLVFVLLRKRREDDDWAY